MAPTQCFRKVLIGLWLRLVTLAVIGLPIALVPKVLEKAGGWLFYQTGGQVVFEVSAYLVFVALCGVAFGTLCTAIIAPFLSRKQSRARIAEIATKVGVAAIAFIDFRILVGVLMVHSGLRSPRIVNAAFALYYLAFAVVLLIPRQRKRLVESLDDALEEKNTRRAVIGLGVASAAVAVAGRTMGKSASPAAKLPLATRLPDRNILLITFDALSAEDMSLYGYHLPTTPRIDDFARRGSVFTDFYSTGTFTTPSVATLLTGLYPSEHHVYHLGGQLHGDRARKTVPHLMRAAGFATGASISNPHAYFLNEGLAGDYDFLPDMAYSGRAAGTLWNCISISHRTGVPGGSDHEFWDLDTTLDVIPNRAEAHFPNRFAHLNSAFPPRASFAQAQEVLDRLPEGFFLWVHAMAPHVPYLPDGQHSGRFLPTGEMRTKMAQYGLPLAPSIYARAQQHLVDKARLRYDEFLADADDAFGDFISGLERSARLRNTVVIVAADHGESFEGGIYGHQSQYLTRPQIHIPLIIRMPGQQDGHRVKITADQTSLAPTILEIAGVPRPKWMRAESLVPWLDRDDDSGPRRYAFSQYLETDSIFKPLTNGTVSVISGGQQYMLDVASGKGVLRSVAEAHDPHTDHARENPELAETMRLAIYARFPELPRRSA